MFVYGCSLKKICGKRKQYIRIEIMWWCTCGGDIGSLFLFTIYKVNFLINLRLIKYGVFELELILALLMTSFLKKIPRNPLGFFCSVNRSWIWEKVLYKHTLHSNDEAAPSPHYPEFLNSALNNATQAASLHQGLFVNQRLEFCPSWITLSSLWAETVCVSTFLELSNTQHMFGSRPGAEIYCALCFFDLPDPGLRGPSRSLTTSISAQTPATVWWWVLWVRC